MSVSTKDDTIVNTIKIEIENIECDSPPRNDKSKLNTLHNTDSNNILNENSDSEFVDNVSALNICRAQINSIERIENMKATSIPAANIDSDIVENSQQKITTKSSGIEIPTSGIRYFKSIGKSVANENSEVNNLLPKILSQTEQVNNQFTQPSTPSVCGNEPSADKPGTSEGSHIPVHKPSAYKDGKFGKVDLYAPVTGPSIYNVKGNIISKSIIVKNLPEVFKLQPVYGRPENKEDLNEFYEQKIRDYVGYGITDNEFLKYQENFNPEYLRTGYEYVALESFPSQKPVSNDFKSTCQEDGPGHNLCTVKKLKLRQKKDPRNHYPRKLKYRGLRMLPLSIVDESKVVEIHDERATSDDTGPLQPGKDLILRLRVYRPHAYGGRDFKSARHSVFNNDVVVVGRQRLTALRDRLVCANDIGMRIDVSDNPDSFPTQSAKQVFPSGFLFINNVFYVDRRPGCRDMSAGVRQWARARRLGEFPVHDMAEVRFDQLQIRLGHPELYLHQGKCEHLFTFSEVRLMSPTDPVKLSSYPCFTRIAQNQSVYCTTCAEFGAKWLVVGCNRVPFDPAFFCDTCFRLYLYDSAGRKIGDFKAYAYGGNTVNFMRPILDYSGVDEGRSENGEESGNSQDFTIIFSHKD